MNHEVATDADLRHAVRVALLRLGMTFAELKEEASHGFSSELSRRTWVAIQDLESFDV